MPDNNNSKIMIIYLLVLAIILFSCPNPSSGDNNDDAGEETQVLTIDFSHGEEASIEISVDLSNMMDLDNIDMVSVVIYEYDETQTLITSQAGMLDSVEGSSFILSAEGLKENYWYSCDINYINGDMNSYMFTGNENIKMTKALAATKVELSHIQYSSFDGQYEGNDAFDLSGTIDLAALDMSLVDICEVSLYGYKDEWTPIEDYEYSHCYRLDGSNSQSFDFVNLDPAPIWVLDVTISDTNHDKRAKDDQTNVRVTCNGEDVTTELTAIHLFDLGYLNNGLNGYADIVGDIDLANVPADIFAVRVDCNYDTHPDTTFSFDFNRITAEDALTYHFINANPLEDYTLTFAISCHDDAHEYEWDSEPTLTISAADLADGQVTSGDFILPAP